MRALVCVILIMITSGSLPLSLFSQPDDPPAFNGRRERERRGGEETPTKRGKTSILRTKGQRNRADRSLSLLFFCSLFNECLFRVVASFPLFVSFPTLSLFAYYFVVFFPLWAANADGRQRGEKGGGKTLCVKQPQPV